ncbi:MAG: hypothetical protein Fur0041_00740 [Bacteroidia bacterium]
MNTDPVFDLTIIKDASGSRIETPFCTASLLEPGIVENKIKEGAFIDVSEIYLLKAANEKLSGNEKYGILVISADFNAISDEARNITADASFVRNTLGKALLVHNAASKLVGNIYISFNKPKMPTRLFTDRDKALKWLRDLKEGKVHS